MYKTIKKETFIAMHETSVCSTKNCIKCSSVSKKQNKKTHKAIYINALIRKISSDLIPQG